MKKIIITLIALGFATSSYAGALGDVLESTSLSDKVQGVYFSNGTPPSNYSLATWNSQGTKIYESGSNTSQITSTDCPSAEPCQAAPTNAPTAYNPFSS